MTGKDSGGLTRGHFLQSHGVGDAAEEVAVAMELFCICAELVYAQKLYNA